MGYCMGKHITAGLLALTLACHGAWAADYRLPDEFVGSYLAVRSSTSCLRQNGADQVSPAYLVVQPMQFRYGFLNPKDENSLDAMACRATQMVLAVNGSMNVKCECFATDRLIQKHFKFTKRAGVLLLQDVEQGTEQEFEVCF